jgi:hypothetical protein
MSVGKEDGGTCFRKGIWRLGKEKERKEDE